MPIFEYKCISCDHKFEELVPNADASVNCPKCGSVETSKLISTFAASTGGSSSSGPAGGGTPSGGCGSGFG